MNSEHDNRPFARFDRHDLEAIVTVLELAAIYLTPVPESEFTAEDLFAEARNIGGEELPLEEHDMQIVLDHADFLEKVGSRLRLK